MSSNHSSTSETHLTHQLFPEEVNLKSRQRHTKDIKLNVSFHQNLFCCFHVDGLRENIACKSKSHHPHQALGLFSLEIALAEQAARLVGENVHK